MQLSAFSSQPLAFRANLSFIVSAFDRADYADDSCRFHIQLAAKS
jgi:hypothetical protein